jgi:proliferating cell nuclear antigen
MTWKIFGEDINKLVMILESSNEKKTFKINLMDLDENRNYEIDPITFPYKITMPTTEFQNYCKNMGNTCEKMDLKCLANVLFMSGTGDLGVIEFELIATNVQSGLTIEKDKNTQKNKIVQGMFELKYLNIFTKCSNLCGQVSLYLQNSYPIIVEYHVSTLGTIKFCLSPCKKEKDKDNASNNTSNNKYKEIEPEIVKPSYQYKDEDEDYDDTINYKNTQDDDEIE